MKWRYYGYSFSATQIKRMSETDLIALDAVRCSSIQEYPDEYTADDIVPLIEQIFKREHPGYKVVYCELQIIE